MKTRDAILLSLLMTQTLPAWGEVDAFQFFQEEAKVVTASRRPQGIRDSPVAVDVITAEDIRASGAVNLWDLLRFRVGMDVLDGRSVDGSRAVVAVRGFPQEHVRNIQVLLDGRSVYSPVTSGVYWDQLPVQLEDIERIEIVRGPSAAFYGSGAGLGVINILTKKPSGSTTLSAHAAGGNRDAAESGAAVECGSPSLAYRASYGFRQSGGAPRTAGGEGNDFDHSHKANLRAGWTLNGGSAIELWAGGSRNRSGLQGRADAESDFNQDFQMLKWSGRFGEHSTVDLVSSRSHFMKDIAPSTTAGGGNARSRVMQLDEEFVQRLEWWDARMHTVYGLNYRHAAVDDPGLFGSRPRMVEELWNGYFNQSATLADSLNLSAAVSWENTNVGGAGTVPNYQVASLWAPLEAHNFRLAYSVAHTVPALFSVAGDSQAPGLHLVGNPELRPETLTSYEAGYRAWGLGNRLELESNAFYTRIEDIDSAVIQSMVLLPSPMTTFGFDNTNQAIARGVEAQAKVRFSRRHSIYANYTYEHVTDWQGNAGDVTANTPTHKLNMGGLFDLGGGFLASLNVGYKDKYLITADSRLATLAVPAYWRLDARLAYTLPFYNGAEVYIAGQNLAVSTHAEFADGLTVPRTYQGGISVRFGGQK